MRSTTTFSWLCLQLSTQLAFTSAKLRVQLRSLQLSPARVTLPAITISGLFHAQDFGAFTLGGTGAHLTSCTLEIAGTIATATKDGEIIAHDLTDVRMTVTANIQVSDSSYGDPTVTAASGWKITGPISETNPDADFPSYTCQLTKTIAADSNAA